MERLIGLGILAALAAAPVPARAQGDAAAALALGRDLYRSAATAAHPDATGGYLRDAIRVAGGRCTSVTAFQLFGQGPDTRTLKVRCGDAPLELVTVDTTGRILLAAGEKIAPMNPADGAIVEVTPVFLPTEIEAASPTGDWRQGLGEAQAAFRDRIWPWLLLAGIVLALGLGWFGWRNARFEAERWRDLTSADKDVLIEESRELYPDIFVHPDGVFIARGRRGKRRLFRSLASAYLYRSRGWKTGEIV